MNSWVHRNLIAIILAVSTLIMFAAKAVAAREVDPVESRVTSLEAQYRAIQQALDDIKRDIREQRGDIQRLAERK